MSSISLIPGAGPVGSGLPRPAAAPVAADGVRGLAGALLRAALCASSSAELDRCGVLRTAVAQARPRRRR